MAARQLVVYERPAARQEVRVVHVLLICVAFKVGNTIASLSAAEAAKYI